LIDFEPRKHENKLGWADIWFGTPMSKENTQCESLDTKVFSYEVRSQALTPQNLIPTNEIAKRLGNGETLNTYDTNKTDSTNFSVFDFIHEGSFHVEKTGRGSIKKNISELKSKKIPFQTKSNLETFQNEIKNENM
jgi:hypothetical protein